MLTLILGGVRSGKSRYASKLAQRSPRRTVYFLATAQRRDSEMRFRIAAHQRARPARWRTIEEARRIPQRLAAIPNGSTVILDCVTLWIARLLVDRVNSGRIAKLAAELFQIARRKRLNLIAVTNEVGCGIIPPSRLGRKYQDALGEVNALLAKKASRVVLMTAGIPRRLK